MEKYFLFTVDVEGIPIKAGGFDYSSIVNGIPLILDLFKEFHVCSTFFMTSDVAENTADSMKEVINHGHEIACHGFEHQLLDLRSRDKQLRNIRKATEAIDENLQVHPVGFRAPVNKANEKTLAVLAELGYRYDSSVGPSYKMLSKYYLPNAPRTPYWPSLKDISKKGESPVLEIPLSVLPWIKLPVGLSYMMLFGLNPFKFFLPRIEQNIVTVFLHPYDLFVLPDCTNFEVIEQKRLFRLLYEKGKGKGCSTLRELLEFLEERLRPRYICAKTVLDHVSVAEIESVLSEHTTFKAST